MTKTEAKKIFGTMSALCRALYVSRQAVYQWPEELPQDRVDQIMGAMMRLGIKTADEVAANIESPHGQEAADASPEGEGQEVA